MSSRFSIRTAFGITDCEKDVNKKCWNKKIQLHIEWLFAMLNIKCSLFPFVVQCTVCTHTKTVRIARNGRLLQARRKRTSTLSKPNLQREWENKINKEIRMRLRQNNEFSFLWEKTEQMFYQTSTTIGSFIGDAVLCASLTAHSTHSIELSTRPEYIAVVYVLCYVYMPYIYIDVVFCELRIFRIFIVSNVHCVKLSFYRYS